MEPQRAKQETNARQNSSPEAQPVFVATACQQEPLVPLFSRRAS